MTSHQYKNNVVYTFRLGPDKDLKQEIISFAKAHHIRAGYIITCVGSLKKDSLQLANQSTATTWSENFEIVSLTGTLSEDSSVHLHHLISDNTGKTIGGHLRDGNIIIPHQKLSSVKQWI